MTNPIKRSPSPSFPVPPSKKEGVSVLQITELTTKILGYLGGDEHDYCNARLVCQEWRGIVDQNFNKRREAAAELGITDLSRCDPEQPFIELEEALDKAIEENYVKITRPDFHTLTLKQKLDSIHFGRSNVALFLAEGDEKLNPLFRYLIHRFPIEFDKTEEENLTKEKLVDLFGRNEIEDVLEKYDLRFDELTASQIYDLIITNNFKMTIEAEEDPLLAELHIRLRPNLDFLEEFFLNRLTENEVYVNYITRTGWNIDLLENQDA